MIFISAAARNSKRWIVLAAGFAVVTLAACGGGGGGANPLPPHVAGNSFRPCTVGLSATSAGNALEIISRPLPPPSPAPPSPQPSVTIASTIALTTSILSNSARFAGQSGLTQLHDVEQDSTALQSTAVVRDTFVSCPANGSGDYRAAGWTSTDSNGVVLTLVDGVGNGLLDILPEMSGASWTNDAAFTLTEVDADGQTSTKTVNADGSYTENVLFRDGTTSTAIENGDGTASYSAPIGGPNVGPNDTVSVGTPKPAASGGPAIPIVIAVPSATPEQFSVPDWYPPGPPALASESDQDLGSATLPAACNVPPSIAASGNKIVRTTTRFDTIFGEIERDVATQYTAAGVGVVCATLNDQLTAYYDYTGQGPMFSGVAQQITTVTETVGTHSLSVARTAVVRAQDVALRENIAQQDFWRVVGARHAAQLRGLALRLRMRRLQP